MANKPGKVRRWRVPRPGLATQVLIGFALGIAAGGFFGEYVAFLNYVGLAFIRLLQMTVLPYVVVSLVAGLGKLGAQDAGRLAVRGGFFVLLLWALGLLLVAVIPLAYPDWESAAFFSSSLIEQPAQTNLLDLYFTSNPFEALARTTVPAVVLFSIALGAALIGVKHKERIIEDLSVIGEALSRVSGFVARLAPIGVFGIAAGTAGTIDVGDLSRIQVHLILLCSMALVLAFVILPGLVALLSPISPMQFLRRIWGALITGFATGSLFVVLPLLAEAAKDLVEDAGGDREEAASTVDVVVPTTYNFPSLGALLSLSFLFFAGWFIGSPVPIARYPAFLISGLFTFFGSATLAIPSLLDQLQLPADLFQLYLAIDVIVSRFGTMVAVIHVTVLAVLGALAMSGRLRVRPARIGPFAGAALGSVAIVLVGSSVYFNHVASSEYKGYRVFVEMEMAVEPVPTTEYDDSASVAVDRRPALKRFEAGGALRVCYGRDALPFAFRNATGRLVGLDVELAHLLARHLGVDLEFVRVGLDEAVDVLEGGRCDVALTAIAMTPEASRRVAFTTPYMSQTAAFLVRDYRRDEFSSRKALMAHESLRLGIPDIPYYEKLVRDYLPEAELTTMHSPRPFLRGEVGDLDAFLYSAEAGSAWTLIYPGFSVAVPRPDLLSIPHAPAVRLDDEEWHAYLSVWTDLKANDGTVDKLYRRWILGQEAQRGGPRWSVIRDVLGWVD